MIWTARRRAIYGSSRFPQHPRRPMPVAPNGDQNGGIADYEIPKVFIHAPMIIRSPVGKADDRWAAALAAAYT